MTRETKIGLLVGMGVIILIGILISDHLSKAQQQQMALVTGVAKQELRGINPADVPAPPRANIRPATQIQLPEVKVSRPTVAANNSAGLTERFQAAARLDSEGTVSNPAIKANTPSPSDAFAVKKGQSPESYANPVPAQDVKEIKPDVIEQKTAPGVGRNGGNPGKSVGATLARNAGSTAPAPTTGDAPAAQVNDAKPTAPVAQNANQPIAGEIYNVKDGDTLYGLAKKFYGDGSMANLILEANKKSLPSASRMRAGVRLVIPPKPGATATAATAAANTSTVAVADKPADKPAAKPVVGDNTTATANTTVALANPPASTMVDYTVKPGETLASIAKAQMGTKNWQKLYDMNKDRIKDPNRVAPGTVIKVPAKKATA